MRRTGTRPWCPSPHKGEIPKLLREWVEIRLEMVKLFDEPDELRKLDARVRSLQQSLGSHAEALSKEDRNSEIYALFVSGLNEVQVHNKRVILGAEYRIPFLVWVVLMVVTIVTMFGVGFQFGLVGNRSVIANLMLALTFNLVMTIIFDLDQPGKGLHGAAKLAIPRRRGRSRYGCEQPIVVRASRPARCPLGELIGRSSAVRSTTDRRHGLAREGNQDCVSTGKEGDSRDDP
jgi:hypothetical protein